MVSEGVRRDPLINEERPSSRLVAAPARTAIGNSIRTLLLVGLLAAVGFGIWWWRRPDDLTPQLGAREWAVTEIDGELTPPGAASTFVLDGDGEARSAVSCATSTGRWWFDRARQRLEFDWQTVSDVACPSDWPPTYRPRSGGVLLDAHTMTIAADERMLRAVDLRGVGAAAPDDFAGNWGTGELTLELGRRGLVTVDGCEGTWSDNDDGIVISLESVSIERGFCSPPDLWVSGATLVPVRVGDSLFIMRAERPGTGPDRSSRAFPLDRDVIRLDLQQTSLLRPP